MITYLFARVYLFFAAATCDKGGSFLGILPKWYKYLPYEQDSTTGRCEVLYHTNLHNGGGIDFNPLLPIGLAVLEMILHLAGVIAVVYVIYGAFRYITSQGEPENTKNARETILNALIGVAIVIIASAAVSFIANKIGG